ncbi:MAG: flagellar biosynthesis protein FlhA [Polyangiaceae bacterium]|nr:flagellar biosynthesis protein FlhA [Polyangiaceae bacterium]
MSADATSRPDTPSQQARDLVLPIAVTGIIAMMVLPLPPFLVDFLLALSLAIAVGVFLIGMFIEHPLEFSAFPAVILVATLLRLSLNVGTTRLILLHGTDGGHAAGKVVETFGRIVVGGNVVVGLVIFLILVVINFIVITKGAGRVAEVAARFALDGMPGKQMAIDAELNAGSISADVARERRRRLEREADFFGAMDGSSKFVKGDAIAGLLITAVNLVAGLAIGLTSGQDLATAAETFTILSVGDALVSQLPALLVSAAAGVVVTRSATGEQLGRAVGTQILGSRRAVGATAGMMTVVAVMPGMPALPFLALAVGLGALAWKPKAPSTPAAAPEVPTRRHTTEEIEANLPLDVLALEVGYELVTVVDPDSGGTVVERIAALRHDIALDLGVVLPPVHVRDNLALEPSAYRFLLLGTEVARGTLRTGRLLALDSSGSAPAIEGEAAKDPAFGTPARWILERDRELAEALGYAVIDHPTIVATHLAEIARRSAHQILGRAELAHLFEVFSRATPKLVEDLVPNLLGMSEVLTVLRNLLREGVSVRDLRSILEALIEIAPATRDTEQVTELLRQRLARQITSQMKGADGAIAALVLEPSIEEMFRRSLREIAQGTGGALDPELARSLGQALDAAVGRMGSAGRKPALVTAPDLRRYVRAFAERRCPELAVLSFRELDPNVTIIPFETVGATPPRGRAEVGG